MARVILLTTNGDVVEAEIELDRTDQICGILGCADPMLLPPRTPRNRFGKPRARVAAFIDRHAYMRELRLNLSASLLFYPEYGAIRGDALIFGYGPDLLPGDVPESLMAVFDA